MKISISPEHGIAAGLSVRESLKTVKQAGFEGIDLSFCQYMNEPEKLLNLNMKVREPIDLQEKFGDDRNLVLYFCSRIDYTYSDRFQPLNYDSIAHQRLLNEMLKMMDK